jgi:hypothetical protein
MKQKLSVGPDPDELFEVPQRDGTVLRKRRDDLDFDDLTARYHGSYETTERRDAKELRAKREADEHFAELGRLKKLRDQKGSRDLGKVSLPPRGSGIAWVPKPRVLLRSRVWASLGIYDHRMLAALECEHADHGGKQNGNLVLTYDDGEKVGIPRRFFNSTLARLSTLGLVNREHRGGYAGGALRDPSLYRLTYLPQKFEGASGSPIYLNPSNEWIEVELEVLDGKRVLKKGRPPPRKNCFRPVKVTPTKCQKATPTSLMPN